MKKLTALLMASSIFICSYAANPIVIEAKSLQWSAAKDLPGAEVAILAGNPSKHEAFVARIKLPAHFQIPLHSHPIAENDTVISGTLYVKLKDEPKEIVLNAGDFIQLAANKNHTTYTKEETILQINGIGPWGMVHNK